MTISVEGGSGTSYTFEGPYYTPNSLANQAGVYLILYCTKLSYFEPVDIGESANLKERVKTHDRQACWKAHNGSQLAYAALYTAQQSQTERMEIEEDIRKNYKFLCGVD